MRNREGWVLKVGTKDVAILDASTKEEVRFSLGPHRLSSKLPKVLRQGMATGTPRHEGDGGPTTAKDQ